MYGGAKIRGGLQPEYEKHSKQAIAVLSGGGHLSREELVIRWT